MIHNWKEGYGDWALVTGASSGIGKEFCYQLANRGMNIVLVARRKNLIEEIALDIELKNGVKTKIINVDITQDFAVDQIYDKLKNIEVGFLVNNAGITKDNLLMRMSEEDFNDVMKINMNSVFNNTKAVLRQMLKQRSGSIINLSSVVGVKGNAGQSNYSSSKAGIIGFTKSVALELGSRNIRCNAIAPGFIETEMTKALSNDQVNDWAESIPLKRTGQVEDIANTSLFLASDMSSYITGQVINVCGGMLT